MIKTELTMFDVISTSSLRAGDLIYWDRFLHMNTKLNKRYRHGTPHLVIQNKFVVGESVITFIDVANNETYTHYSFQSAFIERCRRI